MMKLMTLAAAVAMVSVPALARDGGKVVVEPITTATVNSFGQPIAFPPGPGQIAVSMYNIPAGAELPVHKHPTPRIGYVVSGSLKVTNMQTGEVHTFKKGETVLESVDLWHKGSNPGRTPMKLLVVDLQPKGAGNPTVLKP